MRDTTRADPSRPLRVDVEQDALTGGSRGLDGGAERAVAVAVHLGPLEEFTGLHARHEGPTIEEVVVDAVAFAFSNGACRGTHAEGDSRERREGGLDQGRLARAARTGHHEEGAEFGAVQD